VIPGKRLSHDLMIQDLLRRRVGRGKTVEVVICELMGDGGGALGEIELPAVRESVDWSGRILTRSWTCCGRFDI